MLPLAIFCDNSPVPFLFFVLIMPGSLVLKLKSSLRHVSFTCSFISQSPSSFKIVYKWQNRSLCSNYFLLSFLSSSFFNPFFFLFCFVFFKKGPCSWVLTFECGLKWHTELPGQSLTLPVIRFIQASGQCRISGERFDGLNDGRSFC